MVNIFQGIQEKVEAYAVLLHMTLNIAAAAVSLVCFYTVTACVAKPVQRPSLFPAFQGA